MRYVITKNQLHQIIYKYLDGMFSKSNTKKEECNYNPDAYTLNLHDNYGKNMITYFWYGPGTDDDDNPHYGVGMIHIHPDIVDELRKTIKIRETKVIDIISDWVSETYDVDIDEASIYPYRQKPANY
jgi:hypothetical protein